FFNDNTGMFVALRATTADGLQGDEAFLTANHGHRFVPPRDSVIALEVLWATGRRMSMKTIWDEDPTELLGLEEDEGSNELGGSEFEEDEEEPTEMMGLGEEEGEEEDDSSYEEEEDPSELYASDEEDEYDEEGEQGQETGQRIPGLRIAQGLRTRRRARLIAVAAIRHRRRARILGLAALKRRRRARLFALAALRNRKRARLLGIAAIRNRRRAKAFAIAAVRLRRRVRMLRKVAIGAKLRAAS